MAHQPEISDRTPANNTVHRGISDSTFTIAKIISHLENAKMMADVMTKEKHISYGNKDMFRTIANKARSAVKDITDKLTPEGRKVVCDDLQDPETFLQMDNVATAMLAMPKEQRDLIEEFAMQIYDEYCKIIR